MKVKRRVRAYGKDPEQARDSRARRLRIVGTHPRTRVRTEYTTRPNTYKHAENISLLGRDTPGRKETYRPGNLSTVGYTA